MNIKRAFLILAAALLLPSWAMAGTSVVTFEVDFDFNDSNPAVTTAHIKCDGGLPLESSSPIQDNDNIIFVVEYPEEPNDIDCRVWVDEVANYTSRHYCQNWDSSGCSDYDVDENNDDGTGCFFWGNRQGDENECDVEMDPDYASLRVTKTWDYVGSAANELLDYDAKIGVCADGSNVILNDEYWNGYYCAFGVVYGPSDGYLDVTFDTDYQGDAISIYEWTTDSAVETDMNDCDDFDVFPGGDYSCTIINTVFYEGIPTLNQYGLAIMVLLMLGVGFVGFRRFV